MTLPSQHARGGYRRNDMFRRRRIPRLSALLVGTAVLAIAGFVLWQNLGGGSPGDGTDDALPVEFLARESPESEQQNRESDSAGTRAPADDDSAGNTTAATSSAKNERENELSEDQTSAEAQPLEQEQSPADAAPPKVSPPLAGVRPPQTTLDNPPQRDDTRASALQTQRANQMVRYAFSHRSQGDLVQARYWLTQAVLTGALSEDMSHNARVALKQINEVLVFSPQVVSNDPFALVHKVEPGQTLQKIVNDQDLAVDWGFIMRINNIRDEKKVQAGQPIKLITGPFHAVVDKSDYRLDLYLGEGDNMVFVYSFPVGLGEADSTPSGLFQVSSRLTNPQWVNPRTRKLYLPDDPENPIGEHWIGLKGIDEAAKNFEGYGIHGTIEPDSIGKQQSMGCVRMLPEDVTVIFETLLTEKSTVRIQP